MRVVAAIQARMNSTRLPGKVLRLIEGKPVIVRIWERLALCSSLDTIVVATSADPSNDIIEKVCAREGMGCARWGTDEDVADRLRYVAREQDADWVVRITADCPLVDPGLVDSLVAVARHTSGYEYLSNVYPRTYPDGLDIELISCGCLDRLSGETLTAYIWAHSGEFKTDSLCHDQDLSQYSWTLDTVLDLEFIQWVYRRLPEGFTWQEILRMGRYAPTEYKWRFP